jgi:hypothetical protein
VRNKKPFVLELQGSAEQMGAEHGESLRDVILDLANERLDIILSENPGASSGQVQDLSLEVLEHTRKTLPFIYKESLATSRAAGLPHWLLLVTGGFSDIFDLVAKSVGSGASVNECTLWPAVGPSGAIRLVGTWDSHATAQESLVVVRRQTNTGLSTLAISTAGWPMQQGVTSNGVAFAIANMVAKKRAVGTSYICALPEIVAAATAREAVNRARAIRFCSARYFSFADSSGEFLALECDGQTSWINTLPVAHTNHFIFDDALAAEGRPEIVRSSELRRQAAMAHVDGAVRSISALLESLAFTDATDSSIAQLGEGRANRTCATFVLEPALRRITFTIGPPVPGNIHSFALTRTC